MDQRTHFIVDFLRERSSMTELYGISRKTGYKWLDRYLRHGPAGLKERSRNDRFEVRYVSANGGIRWNRQWMNVSITCVGECVGLEEIDDGVWNVYFGPLKLGRLLERHMRIEDGLGGRKRRL